jgi:hypothetical protein
MALEKVCLVLPEIDSLIEIRFVLRGGNSRTVSWLARLEKGLALTTSEPAFDGLSGRILSAQFSDHVDGRIDRQLEIINRTMSHLKAHCPDFHAGRADLCTWKEER